VSCSDEPNKRTYGRTNWKILRAGFPWKFRPFSCAEPVVLQWQPNEQKVSGGQNMPHETKHNDSPATLVAIVVAARRAGDRELERHVKRQLQERFGLTLNFAKAKATPAADGITPDRFPAR
jgi:hypothetical protein